MVPRPLWWAAYITAVAAEEHISLSLLLSLRTITIFFFPSLHHRTGRIVYPRDRCQSGASGLLGPPLLLLHAAGSPNWRKRIKDEGQERRDSSSSREGAKSKIKTFSQQKLHQCRSRLLLLFRLPFPQRKLAPSPALRRRRRRRRKPAHRLLSAVRMVRQL